MRALSLAPPKVASGSLPRRWFGLLDARWPLAPFGVEDERLDGHPVGQGVDAAVKRADGTARDLFHGFAELADRRVLKEHPHVTQPLMLAQLHERALGR